MFQSIIDRFEYKSIVAAIYIGAVFVQIMDATIINVALPTLAEEFGVTGPDMDWTVLSFTLALAAMTAAAGSVGRRLGLRQAFVLAIVGFTLSSALCGAAQSLPQLVAGRTVQGAFAGLIVPVGSALLFGAFPLSERADASRKVITVAVIAPAIGPIIGGLILKFFSWRWVFFVNVPVGLFALAGSWWLLRRDPPVSEERIDVRGFVLAAVGISSLIYGISTGGERGWSSGWIIGALVIAVVSFAILVPFELRTENALLDFELLRVRGFRTCVIIALPLYAAFFAMIYLLPLFLQEEGSWTALDVGLALFPQAMGVMAATQIVGRFLYKKVGPRRLILAGTLVASAISIWLSQIDPSINPWVLSGVLFWRGFFLGACFVPMQAAVFASIETHRLADATAMYATGRQAAPAFGVAFASTLLAVGLSGVTSSPGRIEAYQSAMLWSSLLLVVAAAVAATLRDSDAAATMNKAA